MQYNIGDLVMSLLGTKLKRGLGVVVSDDTENYLINIKWQDNYISWSDKRYIKLVNSAI